MKDITNMRVVDAHPKSTRADNDRMYTGSPSLKHLILFHGRAGLGVVELTAQLLG